MSRQELQAFLSSPDTLGSQDGDASGVVVASAKLRRPHLGVVLLDSQQKLYDGT